MSDREAVAASERLEKEVDRWGLDGVLMMVADVCYEKAEHIRTNWQDAQTARVWERAAARIIKLAQGVTV